MLLMKEQNLDTMMSKKIISFGSPKSKLYVSNNSIYQKNTVFPNIKTIYEKEDNNLNNIKHKRNDSNLSSGSTSNRSNNQNLSNSLSEEKDKTDENISKEEIKDELYLSFKNDCNEDCFESKKHSRFFDNLNYENKFNGIYGSKNI